MMMMISLGHTRAGFFAFSKFPKYPDVLCQNLLRFELYRVQKLHMALMIRLDGGYLSGMHDFKVIPDLLLDLQLGKSKTPKTGLLANVQG